MQRHIIKSACADEALERAYGSQPHPSCSHLAANQESHQMLTAAAATTKANVQTATPTDEAPL